MPRLVATRKLANQRSAKMNGRTPCLSRPKLENSFLEATNMGWFNGWLSRLSGVFWDLTCRLKLQKKLDLQSSMEKMTLPITSKFFFSFFFLVVDFIALLTVHRQISWPSAPWAWAYTSILINWSIRCAPQIPWKHRNNRPSPWRGVFLPVRVILRGHWRQYQLGNRSIWCKTTAKGIWLGENITIFLWTQIKTFTTLS